MITKTFTKTKKSNKARPEILAYWALTNQEAKSVFVRLDGHPAPLHLDKPASGWHKGVTGQYVGRTSEGTAVKFRCGQVVKIIK